MPSPEAADEVAGMPAGGVNAGPGVEAGPDVETGPDVWAELSVEADAEAVEAVSEILTRYASGGTSVEPAFTLANEGLSAEIDVTRPCVVRAYLPARDRAGVERAVSAASDALGHLQAFGLRPIGELRVSYVHEENWAKAWKSHFPVMRIGRRVIVRPTWRRHRASPDEVVLALDPGMAFGTGLHPTTRLCLAALEQAADEGAVTGRVLDVGSGSGILSVAAAKFGAARVLAVDVDPIAVEATAANARRNSVARRIDVRRGTVPSGEAPFDLVLANLIASLLVELAGPLRSELATNGRLIASGIFRGRESDVLGAFEGAGMEVTRRWAEEDWVALEARPIQGRP